MSEIVYIAIGFLVGCAYMASRRDHRCMKTFEQVDQEVRDELTLRRNLVASLKEDLAYSKRKIQAKQAEIDRLMLEYCPSEMTEGQLSEWKANQRSIDL